MKKQILVLILTCSVLLFGKALSMEEEELETQRIQKSQIGLNPDQLLRLNMFREFSEFKLHAIIDNLTDLNPDSKEKLKSSFKLEITKQLEQLQSIFSKKVYVVIEMRLVSSAFGLYPETLRQKFFNQYPQHETGCSFSNNKFMNLISAARYSDAYNTRTNNFLLDSEDNETLYQQLDEDEKIALESYLFLTMQTLREFPEFDLNISIKNLTSLRSDAKDKLKSSFRLPINEQLEELKSNFSNQIEDVIGSLLTATLSNYPENSPKFTSKKNDLFLLLNLFDKVFSNRKYYWTPNIWKADFYIRQNVKKYFLYEELSESHDTLNSDSKISEEQKLKLLEKINKTDTNNNCELS